MNLSSIMNSEYRECNMSFTFNNSVPMPLWKTSLLELVDFLQNVFFFSTLTLNNSIVSDIFL